MTNQSIFHNSFSLLLSFILDHCIDQPIFHNFFPTPKTTFSLAAPSILLQQCWINNQHGNINIQHERLTFEIEYYFFGNIWCAGGGFCFLSYYWPMMLLYLCIMGISLKGIKGPEFCISLKQSIMMWYHKDAFWEK